MFETNNEQATALIGWPEAPKAQRPKALFVAANVAAETVSDLEAKGWRVVDTRLLPNQTDAERTAAVKAVLEGLRVGSIASSPALIKQLELELKVLSAELDTDDSARNNRVDNVDAALDFAGIRPALKQPARETRGRKQRVY